MNLAKEISFLLYKHHCVILPGFGAFLTNEKAAERSIVGKYALPKQEVISFNRQVKNNDGLVANHLSQNIPCSYPEGLKMVERYIAYLWEVLETKRNVEVAAVGTFYYTQEDKLVFVPYHSVNFSRDSYGLPKLRLKELSQQPINPTLQNTETPKVKLTVRKEDKPQTEIPAEQKNKPAVKPSSKTIARMEVAEAKKRENQEKKTAQGSRKRSSLFLINSLGSLFLIGIVCALFNFEMTSSTNAALDNQVASLLDSPKINIDIDENGGLQLSEKQDDQVITEKMPLYAIYAQAETLQIAENVKIELESKYANVAIETAENGVSSVFIISFSSEELAKEYKALIQNKINQKLVIIEK